MARDDQLALAVAQNVVDIHVFFVDWFRGVAAKEDLEDGFLKHLDPGFFFIPPSGVVVPKAQMAEMFMGGHGVSPLLEIEITDVVIRCDLGDHILVSYVETQRGALPPDAANNQRLSTLLMTKAQPFKWLSVHETAISA